MNGAKAPSPSSLPMPPAMHARTAWSTASLRIARPIAPASAVRSKHAVSSSSWATTKAALTAPSSRRSSASNPLVVLPVDTAPEIPEGRRHAAIGLVDQHREMRVPAAAYAHHLVAIGELAMRQGQQHLVTLRRKVEDDFGRRLQGESKPPRRIVFGDRARPFVALGVNFLELLRGRRLVGRKIGVLEAQRHLAADPRFHRARREPFAAFL